MNQWDQQSFYSSFAAILGENRDAWRTRQTGTKRKAGTNLKYTSLPLGRVCFLSSLDASNNCVIVARQGIKI